MYFGNSNINQVGEYVETPIIPLMIGQQFGPSGDLLFIIPIPSGVPVSLGYKELTSVGTVFSDPLTRAIGVWFTMTCYPIPIYVPLNPFSFVIPLPGQEFGSLVDIAKPTFHIMTARFVYADNAQIIPQTLDSMVGEIVLTSIV